MIALIDYGVGNLFSLESSFKAIGETAVVTGDPDVIHKADRLILPGVGAFGDAIKKLEDAGLDTVIKKETDAGKPLLETVIIPQLGNHLAVDHGCAHSAEVHRHLVGLFMRKCCQNSLFGCHHCFPPLESSVDNITSLFAYFAYSLYKSLCGNVLFRHFHYNYDTIKKNNAHLQLLSSNMQILSQIVTGHTVTGKEQLCGRSRKNT